MKRKIALSMIGAILYVSSYAQTTKRVLFLGNSYIATNNLPQIIEDLASSTGDNLIHSSNTPGGYRLLNHSTNATSLNSIMTGNWDYVVLQEQSQYPAFRIGQVKRDVFPYARALDSVITKYNSCGETMFYMTWGRKYGDTYNCPTNPSLCTYESMDSLLHLRYMMMADTNDAVVSPVGAVWRYIRENHPAIELYQADQSHPSLAGSYAAACCFYTSIFRKNPLLITHNYSLPPTDAAAIRAAVKAIVYDNFLEWHIGEYDPASDFDFTVEDNIVTFTNSSTNSTHCKWNFGDGTISTDASPIHTYAANAAYTVKLISYNCSFSDTLSRNVTIGVTDVESYYHENSITLYPNPVNDQLTINLGEIESIDIINSMGQTLSSSFTTSGQTTFIDFSEFAPGVYVLLIKANEKTYKQKISKK